MKKSPSVVFAGLVLSTLVAFTACSGTPTDDGRQPEAGRGTEERREMAQDPQDPQDPMREVQQQREEDMVADSLRRARRNMNNGKWVEALQAAIQALEIDRENTEARAILERAQQLLGERVETIKSRELTMQEVTVVEQERDRARALREAELGDANRLQGNFDAAVENYEFATTILRYSPYFSPGSALYAELNQKLEDAREQRRRALQEKLEADEDASEAALAEVERQNRIGQAARIRALFEDANRNFQRGHYDAALRSLDAIKREQPFHAEALSLYELATRARHNNRIEMTQREWKAQWAKAIDDLNMSDLPQTEVYKYFHERWREVSRREPMQFNSEVFEESPEEQAIMARLQTSKEDYNFAEATIDDWARYFATRTQVNFVVGKSARDLDAEVTTLRNFKLENRTPAQALDVIGLKTGVRWKVQDSLVMLVTEEHAGGRMYFRQYGVRDIVGGVPDRPGPEPKLTIPGEEEPFPFEDEEARATVVEVGSLETLIRDNIAVDTWDPPNGSIGELKGTLLIRHTREVHRQVDKHLTDHRESVGIQVDVQSRFLRVEDNFLADIGFDFRGLGNNSSEGIPGRGLEGRPNVSFDDFGRRENINPASPGTLGTGTEPGIFYDDGGDGDIFGRTEHLFDTALGGNSPLDNSGGLSLQYAFLDDTEVEMIFRAVAKNDRSQEITAPRLLVYNNARANMSVLRQSTYIKDFEVEIAQAAAVANPVIGVVKDGVSLDVRPVVSADRRFITMELRPTVLDLILPIPTFTTTLGVGQPITIQLPETTLKRVRTTVTMPDGGTVLLGGMKVSNKQQLDAGIPILNRIPIVSFFFSRKGNSVANMNLLILIRASVVIPAEHEPVDLVDPYDPYVGGGR